MNDDSSPAPALDTCRAAIVAVAPDLAAEVTELDLDVDLWDELELDSMDQLNVLTHIAATTDTEIPESDYGRLRTLRSLAAYVEAPGG